MAFQNLLKNLQTVKRCHLPNQTKPNQTQKIGDLITRTHNNPHLTTSSSQPCLSDLTPNHAHLVLSDPHLKTSQRIDFFNFLLNNHSSISFNLDLHTHFVLLRRLIKARRFTDAENHLNSLSTNVNLRYPYSDLASFVENHCVEPKILAKLFNLMLKVYSDSQKFDEALETFNYMRNCTSTK
ncbi:pentatricopeptide repeat-containing protein At2g28050-like [Camellia sinensis]|uniref:pentatricopeptide repeat-containing protein At2g28050-like n=1 Tax=Camellia sinensis TaxID=4442 RepID=UPI0010364EB0|nr:pentatricopeptide repeat-containing protein At2g28050-like [Camellia sinensis]